MSVNTINDQDYLFLSAMIKVREARALTRDRMERMVDAPSFDDATKLLSECGYKDMAGMNSVEIEKTLSAHRAEIFRELSQLAPEKEIVDAFRIRFDYHNAKVMVKSEGANVDAAYLLSDAGRIAPEKLINAYQSDDFRLFPVHLRTAIVEAKSVLARTENPQLADFILDKAYFAELYSMGEKFSMPFFKQYAGALADSANLRAAVRTLRMGRDIEFLRRALVSGGSRGAESLAQAAFGGDGLAACYAGTVFEDAAAKGVLAANGGNLSEFELACDNAVTKFLSNAKYVGFGAETVIAYLASIENEITAARMILTGKLSGVAPAKLKERLRDTYA